MKKTIMMIIAIAMMLMVLVGCGKQYDDKIGTAKMYVVEHHDAASARTGEKYCMDDEECIVEFENGKIESWTRGQWEQLKKVAER